MVQRSSTPTRGSRRPAKQADLYLPFYSGTDVAILNCLMQQIIKNGWENKDFIKNRTKDYEKVKES